MLRRSATPVSRAAVAVVTIGFSLTLLAGCAPEPTPTPTPSPSASAGPETGAPAPAFLPEGTAAENLPIFTQTAQAVWESERRAEGRAYIDALIGVGFDRAAMQVTNDLSTVGNPAESIQFSVRWGESECLVGQVGPSTGGLVAKVLPQLAEGRCLVGETRPIDW